MNKEIEARFLNVDKKKLVEKAVSLGAIDNGEKTLTEIIFYDKDATWHEQGRFVRLRTSSDGTKLTYKQNKEQTIDSALEIEFSVSDMNEAKKLLETIGLVASRHQEKRRHTLLLNNVIIDIDTWPKIPTYVEFEGPSEREIRAVVEAVGFDWVDAVFDDARKIIQDRYGIPVGKLQWFTFEKCE